VIRPWILCLRDTRSFAINTNLFTCDLAVVPAHVSTAEVDDPPLPGTNKTDSLADHGRSRCLTGLLRPHRLGKYVGVLFPISDLVTVWHFWHNSIPELLMRRLSSTAEAFPISEHPAKQAFNNSAAMYAVAHAVLALVAPGGCLLSGSCCCCAAQHQAPTAVPC
jgi:hypothetical protein